ncbi:MAG: hypothetical protein HYX49_08995 [Chloroflexi bacterium]|nr:hypothetical protein [Chloroflexota bacterium]
MAKWDTYSLLTQKLGNLEFLVRDAGVVLPENQIKRLIDLTLATPAPPALFDRLTRITGGASGDRTILVITPVGETMWINVAGNLRIVPAATSLDINVSANWITTTYATAANRAGLSFKIYAIENGGASAPLIKCNLASNAPPANSRLIGGFHCLCVAVGTITGHKLTGYVAGDILPQSVWDLKFAPRKNPDGTYRDGFVYDPKDGIWKGIYLVNTSYLSQYNTPKLVNVNWMDITTYLGSIGARLLRDREFQLGAEGSSEGTSITGSADTPNTGGHVDTAGRRIISNIGCEDMVGLIWQWLDEQSYQYGASTWSWKNVTGGKGQLYTQDSYGDTKLLAGGDWVSGALCGSRGRHAGNSRWVAATNVGGRAGVDPE